MTEKIEYRVRPVTRYIVTRFEDGIAHAPGVPSGPMSRQVGEFDNATTAYAVGYAACKLEHDRLGWEPGDERIQYPDAPAGVSHDEIRF